MNHLGDTNKMVGEDHIPDIGKMVSDTPRTNEQINGKPCTRFECLVGDSLRDALVPSQFARQLERELNAANERIKRLEDCAETAWGIIANVDSGSWQEQRADWREAATRWRDEQFHPELSERKSKEAKP